MSDVRYSYSPDYLDHLLKLSNGKAFRKKVDPCPYCEPKCGMFEKPKFATEWDKEGIVREIVFIRNQMGPYYKRGYAVMISACPRCKKLSFHHRDIGFLLRDSWADKKIVQAEIDAWRQETLDEWNASLCKRCAVKKEVDEKAFGYVVDCEKGFGSPESPLESTVHRCKLYVPIEPNTCFACGKESDGNLHLECAKTIAGIDRVAHEEWVKQMKGLGIDVE